MKLLPVAPKFSRLIRYILRQFSTPNLRKVVRGAAVPDAGALVRLGHSLTRVKIWGRSTPQGPKYGLPNNALWVGTIQHLYLQGHWTKLHRTCFA